MHVIVYHRVDVNKTVSTTRWRAVIVVENVVSSEYLPRYCKDVKFVFHVERTLVLTELFFPIRRSRYTIW